jgi:hypothetical protein
VLSPYNFLCCMYLKLQIFVCCCCLCSTLINVVIYLNVLRQLVSMQGQIDFMYFGLSPNYVAWFRRYLTCRQASVQVSGFSSSYSYTIAWCFPGRCFGSLVFCVFFNGICRTIVAEVVSRLPTTSNLLLH